MTFEVLK